MRMSNSRRDGSARLIAIRITRAKGLLAEYYIRENPAIEGFHNIKVLDDSGDFWPGAGCDLKYYRKKVNKSIDDDSLDLEHCDWLEPRENYNNEQDVCQVRR